MGWQLYSVITPLFALSSFYHIVIEASEDDDVLAMVAGKSGIDEDVLKVCWWCNYFNTFEEVCVRIGTPEDEIQDRSDVLIIESNNKSNIKYCCNCGAGPNPYAEANQENGSYICWACKNGWNG